MKTLFCILAIAYLLVSAFLALGTLIFCEKEDRERALIVSIIPVFHIFPIIALIRSGYEFWRVMYTFSFNLWEAFYDSRMIDDNTDYAKIAKEYEDCIEEIRKKREVHDR